MKKLIIFSALLVVGLLSNLQSISANTNTVYNGELLEYCVTNHEAYEYLLLAGQDIEAGTVVITTNGSELVVTVNALGELDDVHIYLYGEDDPLPTKRPVPGKAPYKLENIDGNTATITIPFEEGDYFVLAIHVAFEEVDSSLDPFNVAGETAYAAGPDAEFEGRGAWFYLVDFHVIECVQPPVEAPVLFIAAHAALTNGETAWALGEYTFIEEGISNKWGWFLSVDTYGTHTFDIYYGAGNNSLTAGTLIGTLEVEYGVTEVTVTYTLTQPLLDDFHVFVGYAYPTTGAPGQYDYIVENLNGVYVGSVTILVEDIE